MGYFFIEWGGGGIYMCTEQWEIKIRLYLVVAVHTITLIGYILDYSITLIHPITPTSQNSAQNRPIKYRYLSKIYQEIRFWSEIKPYNSTQIVLIQIPPPPPNKAGLAIVRIRPWLTGWTRAIDTRISRFASAKCRVFTRLFVDTDTLKRL